jgi:ferredoxin/flavodoxin---NADP+ reductase
MFERLPVPYGLVRFGVAPDHPKLKQPALVFDKIARTPGFEFYGNVEIGSDISVAALLDTHHAVIFAYGAQEDRSLGVPGEELPGSHGAAEFVGWYNGHPDYQDRRFDLSSEVAVVIGQGNVAADLTRMLLQPVDRLRGTDIAANALDSLARSRVRVVHIIGRRGAAQAKFTTREIQELIELPDCSVEVAEDGMHLGATCLEELQESGNTVSARNVELFRKLKSGADSSAARRIVFHFCKSPVEIIGPERVRSLVFERNTLAGSAFRQVARGTGTLGSLDCGLVFRSIGYRGSAMPDVPFEEQRGVIPNLEGRVRGCQGLYVTGWIKRGPSGLIGTNRADSVATVSALLADAAALSLASKYGPREPIDQLTRDGLRVVDYTDWLRINDHELERGRQRGRAREKCTATREMLDVLSGAVAEQVAFSG